MGKHHKHAKKEGKEHKKKHHHHHKHDDKKEAEKKPDDKKSFVQLKDFDEDEDKEILESIKYAENKLGAKMGTPKALPKEHAHAPIKYDVETLTQKDTKYMHKAVKGIESEKGDAGDCDVDDGECRKDSVKLA